MYETLKRMYNNDKIDKVGLKTAVSTKGWITPTEYEQITGEPYVE
jgi:hypothetical protein